MSNSTITLNLSELNKNCVQDKEDPDIFVCNVINSTGASKTTRVNRNDLLDETKSTEFKTDDFLYEHDNDVKCMASYTGFSKTKGRTKSNICIQNCKDNTPFFEYENNYPVCKYRPTITYRPDSDIADNITCSDGFLVTSDNTYPGVTKDFTDQLGMCIGLPLSYNPDNVVNGQS